MTDLTALTPAEIDALWAPLAYATFTTYWAEVEARNAARQAQRKIEDPTLRGWFESVDTLQETVQRNENRIPALHRAWLAADEKEVPFRAEWTRRQGWRRAYLVTNNGGHVHRSTECPTCFPSTRFEWLTEQSGKDEAEIVELAGERACTVCYPSAPVETRNRPTRLFGEAEIAAQKAREERAAKKAARDAEKFVVEGYDGRKWATEFKSVRAVTNAIASELDSLVFYGETHPSAAQWIKNIQMLRDALAARGIEYDYDAKLTQIRKRIDRTLTRGARY